MHIKLDIARKTQLVASEPPSLYIIMYAIYTSAYCKIYNISVHLRIAKRRSV